MKRYDTPPDDILDYFNNIFTKSFERDVEISNNPTLEICNRIYTGNVTINGEVYGFIIESGNSNGMIVHAWGNPDEIGIENKPRLYTLVPKNDNLKDEKPALYNVFLHWTKEQ